MMFKLTKDQSIHPFQSRTVGDESHASYKTVV